MKHQHFVNPGLIVPLFSIPSPLPFAYFEGIIHSSSVYSMMTNTSWDSLSEREEVRAERETDKKKA